MKLKQKAGFTLIELLVVVLIIAVLTAVAVPMYKHAVLKSRFSTVMPMAKSVAEAQEVYYLSNGQYALDKESLDITAMDAENTTTALSQKDGYEYVLAQRSDIPGVHYIMYQQHSANFPSEIHCESNTEEGQWLCEKGLGGKYRSGSITSGYKTYILSGEGTDSFPAIVHVDDGSTTVVIGPGESCKSTGFPFGTCNGHVFSQNAECYAHGSMASGCVSTFTDHSVCNAGTYACYGATFRGNSTCESWGSPSCQSTFNEDSSCDARVGGGCFYATFNGNSVCYDNAVSGWIGGCKGGTFNGNSKCYASSLQDSCTGTYTENACCVGENCPSGVPICQ